MRLILKVIELICISINHKKSIRNSALENVLIILLIVSMHWYEVSSLVLNMNLTWKGLARRSPKKKKGNNRKGILYILYEMEYRNIDWRWLKPRSSILTSHQKCLCVWLASTVDWSLLRACKTSKTPVSPVRIWIEKCYMDTCLVYTSWLRKI